MSALVCGKRSFLEDLCSTPPITKRIRCSGNSSPIRIARSPSLDSSPVSHLRSLFPDMDQQYLQAALEVCDNDLASAVKRLTELRLQRNERDLSVCQSESELRDTSRDGEPAHVNQRKNIPVENCSGNNEGIVNPDSPVNGSDWVDLFLSEMQNASDMIDAKMRASKALEALEKAIHARSGPPVENLQKENLVLRQQVENLTRDNSILRRAVAIQHERQKEHEERGNELQQLRQLISQYQEQLRTLEVNNYALTLHLRQAQQSSSIPGRFHPDVF
eukprot:TRINITY_DN316_c0_g4_i1.p1 TRINITY_DN316_c0_g4~~TRINITY_DN316_c0_g4_i1.p1  ORF type:complete len:275 (-),score=41.05 TRINITY_DN316_c0_g4_i1:462-1286(-)